MKKINTSVTILAFICGTANAAIIYDKDGSKIDLNGRVKAEYYFSNDNSKNGDQTNSRLGFKVDSELMKTLQDLASGNINLEPTGPNQTAAGIETVWLMPGYATTVSDHSVTGVHMGLCIIFQTLPIAFPNSVVKQ